MKKQWNNYLEILRQYKYPQGVTSTRPIRCTEEQAKQKIGSTHRDNPAWFVEDMLLLQADVRVK